MTETAKTDAKRHKLSLENQRLKTVRLSALRLTSVLGAKRLCFGAAEGELEELEVRQARLLVELAEERPEPAVDHQEPTVSDI